MFDQIRAENSNDLSGNQALSGDSSGEFKIGGRGQDENFSSILDSANRQSEYQLAREKELKKQKQEEKKKKEAEKKKALPKKKGAKVPKGDGIF